MRNLILAAVAALSMQLAVSAGLSDTVGGRTLTQQQKTELLAYQGRSPLIKLEQAVLVVKLDIEAGKYSLNSPFNYRQGTVATALRDTEAHLAYFYSSAFKILTWQEVFNTQREIVLLNDIHNHFTK